MENQEDKAQIIKSPIISCSRRTDIPAFLMEWVIHNIKIGYVDVTNPFNKNQVSRVSLKPEDVKSWVWWSKNFHNWINAYQTHTQLFNSYKGHMFQFTINSPSELEQNLRISLEERFSQMKWLIDKFGTIAVSYRFDPIILYRRKNEISIRSNLDRFECIIEKVSALGIKEMTFSFATMYSKVENRMSRRGYIPIDPSLKRKKEILDTLINICDKNDMQLKACCQSDLIKEKKIKQAHCIDANIIERIVGEKIPKVKDSGQRKACGCFKSKDIGGYSGIFLCRHNCDYCYASPAKK